MKKKLFEFRCPSANSRKLDHIVFLSFMGLRTSIFLEFQNGYFLHEPFCNLPKSLGNTENVQKLHRSACKHSQVFGFQTFPIILTEKWKKHLQKKRCILDTLAIKQFRGQFFYKNEQ